jgi:tyrosine-protein kinase Etk/Wzc
MKSEAVSDPIQEDLTQVADSQDVHLLDLLIILSKRRKFIVLFTVGVAVLTAITVLLLPSEYTAETLVLPPSQNSSMSSALLGQLGGSSALASAAGASLGIKSPGDMYVSLFHSRTVEDAMVQRFGLMARYRTKKITDARKAFESHSKVSLGTKDGLITIRVEDRDPNMAAEIANGYVDQFRKLSANLAITEASQRRMFFEQQLKEANESLTNAEDAMKRTQQSTGVLQVDSQARSLIESAAVLRGQIVAQEVQLQGMRSYATEDNPQVVMAEQQLAALKGQLVKLSGSDANSSSEIIVPKGNIPQAGMEYLRKLRDMRYYETIEQLIAKQYEMAKLDEARQGAIIQVADVAVPPDKRSFPKRTITVILATMLTFMVTCAWCFLDERFRMMKRDPEEGKRLDALRATFGKQSRHLARID